MCHKVHFDFFYGGSEVKGGIKLGYGYSGILNKLLLSNMRTLL